MPLIPFSCVNVTNLTRMLTSHPDRELVKYVLEGLVNGFDVGFLHGGALNDALKNNKVGYRHAITRFKLRGCAIFVQCT